MFDFGKKIQHVVVMKVLFWPCISFLWNYRLPIIIPVVDFLNS